MSYLGNNRTRPNEVVISRRRVTSSVKQLFRRSDFPREIFIALGDSAMASCGDVVWANLDVEHPHDFVPMARIDELVINLPSPTDLLSHFHTDSLTHISVEEADRFWNSFDFQLADEADGVRLTWE